MTNIGDIQNWLCSICATGPACDKVKDLDRSKCAARIKLEDLILDLDLLLD